MNKAKTEVVFQCDGFAAIKHALKLPARKETVCGFRPSQKQYDTGSVAYEHDCRGLQYSCNTCFPQDHQ